jgi:hypothetical protein
MAILNFSGASASAGVTILLRDMGICRVYPRLACGQFALSLVLVFIVWLLDAVSFLSGFWLLVSFF